MKSSLRLAGASAEAPAEIPAEEVLEDHFEEHKGQVLAQFEKKTHLKDPEFFLKVLASGKLDAEVFKDPEVHTAAVKACGELAELVERGEALPSRGSIFRTILRFRTAFDLKEVRFSKAQILLEFKNGLHLKDPSLLLRGLGNGGAEPEALHDSEVHALALETARTFVALADGDQILPSGDPAFGTAVETRRVFDLMEIRFTKQQILHQFAKGRHFEDPKMMLAAFQRDGVEPGVMEDEDVRAAVEMALADLRHFSEARHWIGPGDGEASLSCQFRELLSLPEIRVDLSFIRPRVSHEVWEFLQDARIPPQARLSYQLKIQDWLQHHSGDVVWNTPIPGVPPIPAPEKVVPKPNTREVGELYEPPPSPDVDSGVRKPYWKVGAGVKVARGTLDRPDDPDSERVGQFTHDELRRVLEASVAAANETLNEEGEGIFDRAVLQGAVQSQETIDALDRARRRARLMKTVKGIQKRRGTEEKGT